VTVAARQSQSWYPQDAAAESPRIQYNTYVERVADVLETNRGRRVHLEAVLGGDPWIVHEAVEILRSFGWVILGEQGRAGYMYVRWERPRRWTRIEQVCRDHIAAVVMYLPKRRYYEPSPGQLQFELN
jgi:hypothetical protein